MDSKRVTKLLRNNNIILVLVLFGICLALSISTEYFATPRNVTAVLQQMSTNGILATGMTMCIITAGINLSVGSVLSFCGIVLALCLQSGMSPVTSIMISILAGSLCGVINGGLVTVFKIPPFIATLGMQSVASGVALMLTDGRPISGVSNGIVVLGSGKIGIVPVSFLIMIGCFIVAHILMNYMRVGRYFYTIGGNEEAARLSGVNIYIYKALPFVISGIFSALAAVVVTGRLNSAEPVAGSGMELDAIAASVIGGTSMSGGEGKIVGTFLGVVIMSVIRNGMIQLNVGTYPQQVVIGVIIIVVVLIDMMNRKKN